MGASAAASLAGPATVTAHKEGPALLASMQEDEPATSMDFCFGTVWLRHCRHEDKGAYCVNWSKS